MKNDELVPLHTNLELCERFLLNPFSFDIQRIYYHFYQYSDKTVWYTSLSNHCSIRKGQIPFFFLKQIHYTCISPLLKVALKTVITEYFNSNYMITIRIDTYLMLVPCTWLLPPLDLPDVSYLRLTYPLVTNLPWDHFRHILVPLQH
jgi:hypothetical protein